MKENKSTCKIAVRIFAAMIVLFLLLLGGRFLYNLFAPEKLYDNQYVMVDYEALGIRNNIATNRLAVAESAAASNSGVPLGQKYERVANLTSRSFEFEKDLAGARALLEENGGIVQAENSDGLPGGRSISLTIGVRPEAFEALRLALEGVGTLEATSVSTTDRTSEFRLLLAEKESLEGRLERYDALKQHEGSSLQDQLALEAQIMRVDGELRTKLVELARLAAKRA